MSFLYNLCSSSSGNATYIGTQTEGFFIDMGTGVRTVLRFLKEAQIEKRAVQGIFLTHEHSDHVKGLSTLLKYLPVPVYASRGTLLALYEKGILSNQNRMIPLNGPADIGRFIVTPYATSHDAAESVCYKIKEKNGATAAVCTDLGYVSEEIEAMLSECSTVMLESNHDREMLRNGPYPYFLKKRILSDSGHLSNAQAAQTVRTLADRNLQRVLLAHLSEHNNLPALALQSSLEAVGENACEVYVLPKWGEGRRFFL